MRRRLLYLLPLLALLFSSVLAFWQPKTTEAVTTSGFSYTNTTYKTIRGPNVDVHDHVGNYDLLPGGVSPVYNYSYAGCTDSIFVKKAGDTNGTLQYGCGANKTKPISIASPQGNGGSGQPADYVGTFINHSTITANNETFVDSKIDDDLTFNSTSGDSCTSQDQIYGFNPDIAGWHHSHVSDTAKIDLHTVPGGGNNNCVKTTYTITFQEAPLGLTAPEGSADGNGPSAFAYNAYFAWQDSGTITTSDGTGYIFSNTANRQSGGSIFYDNGSGSNSDSSCLSQITADVGSGTGQLVLRTSGDRKLQQGWPPYIANAKLSDNGQGCKESGPITVALADPVDSDGKTASSKTAGSGSTGTTPTSNTNNQQGCAYLGGSPLTWIICPIVTLMAEFVGKADNAITNQLEVNTNNIYCSNPRNSCAAYYTAWQEFRNISLGLMVIGGLVMVIAQALGTELLDAYTLRKVLPRLLIAAIGITISWPLMQFFVTLSNDLGIGIRHLIYAPFLGLDNTIHLRTYGVGTLLGGIGLVGGGIALTTWLIFGGAGIIVSLLGTAVLALFVALFVLVLRQVLITLMIILAPIAIVAYILPNTQKVYHVWWESFSKALLMFPLIAAIIASGRVFSAVANSNTSASGPSGLIWGLAAFTAYFAPYFLIPATFRLAGGALRNIGGFVNDRGKGGFDRLRNYRANRAKKGREDFSHKAQTGDLSNKIPARFRRTNRLVGGVVGGMNVVGQRFGAGFSGGYGFGKRGVTAREGLLMAGAETASKEKGMRDSADINAFNRLMVFTARFHGDEQRAGEELKKWYASDHHEYPNVKFSPGQVEEKVRDAKARMRNAGGYNPGRAAAAFLAMGQDGTAIRDVEDMGDVAAWVSEGSENVAYRFISQVGSVSKQRGRSELAPAQDHRGKLAAAVVKKHKGEVVKDYDKVLAGATMSGAGGDTGLSVLSGAPSRSVRSRVDDAMKILAKYEAEPSSVGFDTAAQAASVVLDLKNNVDIGYGTVDNKITYQQAMDVGERRRILDKFLKDPDPRGTPRQVQVEVRDMRGKPAPAPATTEPATTFDYIKTLVGEKYASMPQEQLVALQDQARQQLEQQQQQDQQRPQQ